MTYYLYKYRLPHRGGPLNTNLVRAKFNQAFGKFCIREDDVVSGARLNLVSAKGKNSLQSALLSPLLTAKGSDVTAESLAHRDTSDQS